MAQNPILAIISGDGITLPDALTDIEEHQVNTPFGLPSAPIIVGSLNGLRVAFLSRHGFGNTLSSTQINYRANIYALRSLGIERIVAVSACGSLREDYAPGDLILPDQLVDHTTQRNNSFFHDCLTAQISPADPFCPTFTDQVEAGIRSSGSRYHRGGVMVAVEGPRFSTRAESNLFRSWGMALIGMTTAPEAFLALEAEMCYSVIAHVTDYDAWHTDQPATNVKNIRQSTAKSNASIQNAILELTTHYDPERNCSCRSALKDALNTSMQQVSEEMKEKYSLLLGKYFK